MMGIHLEVILAVGYALFLLTAALILEGSARHTHGRAKMYRHRGFRFIQHLDVWECPAGEHLSRRETDEARRLVRYRAKAEKCNSCALKNLCTDSGEGREIVHSTQNWIDTEVGRFHRGLSLALLGMAALILMVFWIRHHHALESLILAASLAGVLAAAFVLARSYWKDAFGKRAASGRSGLLTASPWSSDGESSSGAGPLR